MTPLDTVIAAPAVFIPGVGEVLLLAGGAIVIAGVTYYAGSWIAQKVTTWYREHTKNARKSTKDKHTKPRPGRAKEKAEPQLKTSQMKNNDTNDLQEIYFLEDNDSFFVGIPLNNIGNWGIYITFDDTGESPSIYLFNRNMITEIVTQSPYLDFLKFAIERKIRQAISSVRNTEKYLPVGKL